MLRISNIFILIKRFYIDKLSNLNIYEELSLFYLNENSH